MTSRDDDEKRAAADVAPATATPEAASGVPGIREPDEGALPVATFSEEDYEKRERELPSARWRKRAWKTLVPALVAATLSGLGLSFLARTPGFEGVGVLTVLCAPLIIGAIASLFPAAPDPRRRVVKRPTGSVGTGVLAAFLVCVAAMPLTGEGFICVMMATPFLLLFSAGAAALANKIVDKRLDHLDDKFRAGLMLLVTLVVPLACSALDQLLFYDKGARSTVSSSITVPYSRAEVWDSLRHLDVTFDAPSRWSVEALLPVPVAIRGDGAEPGAVRKVEFHNGTVLATVTSLVPERTYAIDLDVRASGREFFDHWIDLEHSRFDLIDAEGGTTTLVHTTTYRPILFPRLVFEPLERSLGGVIQARLVDVYARQVLDPARPHLARVP